MAAAVLHETPSANPATPDDPPFGGVDLIHFAATKGTPFCIYDGPAQVVHLRELRASLGGNLLLSGRVGSHPNLHVLRWLQPHQDGFVVTSGIELRLAIAAGEQPQRINYLGPGKGDAELELAIGSRLGSISVESEGELERMDQVARRLGRKAPVALRINLRPATTKSEPPSAAPVACFGFAAEQGEELVAAVAQKPGCRYEGLYFNLDVATLPADAVRSCFSRALEIVGTMAYNIGQWPGRILVAGGEGGMMPPYRTRGFGDCVQLYRDLSVLWADFKAKHTPPEVTVILALDVPSGSNTALHVARVVATHTFGDIACCILDGGVPSPLLGGDVVNLSSPDGNPRVPVQLTGLLCSRHPDDRRDTIPMPQPRIGDYVGIYENGGHLAGPGGLFSRLTQAEYLVTGQDQVKTIRHVMDPSRIGIPP
ncbi:MAG: hypothetical protein HQL63_05895 [Magnetococcales bacterium]|nr:hypothetical protein [Magnetococcales bacterium]